MTYLLPGCESRGLLGSKYQRTQARTGSRKAARARDLKAWDRAERSLIATKMRARLKMIAACNTRATNFCVMEAGFWPLNSKQSKLDECAGELPEESPDVMEAVLSALLAPDFMMPVRARNASVDSMLLAKKTMPELKAIKILRTSLE
mmetsp:Transcript_4755/g.13462  ORF Transcript_4755/g.13462 Transcript_4755/m.13462 type:complete len:148 (+) Transcript_4755:871-1314(+)